MPGVTRDRVSIPLRVDDRWVELMDTGGYGFSTRAGSRNTSATRSTGHGPGGRWCCHRRHQDGLTSAIRRSRRCCGERDQDGAGGQQDRRPQGRRGPGRFRRLGFGRPSASPRSTTATSTRSPSRSGGTSIFPRRDGSAAAADDGRDRRQAQLRKSTLVNAIAEVYEGQGDGDRVGDPGKPATASTSASRRTARRWW